MSQEEELDAATLARLQASEDELARGEVVTLEGLHQAMLMRQAHIWRRQSTTTEPIPGTDPDDGFYVEDEPLADLLDQWDAHADEVHLTEAPGEGN